VFTDDDAMRIILMSNPHRVFISRVGRAEIFQPIPPPGGPPMGPIPTSCRSGSIPRTGLRKFGFTVSEVSSLISADLGGAW
jgi:hypothetical protein